ncbi:GntR family transcriptional regulator [Paenibacillus sp. FSL L8-0436]|uniref:GntR family transcriptional regulator n=1 Tax=Paenibacillus sp. FSL L8-0436 TaxID=2954686 RepID=UPI0031595A2E
MLNAENAEPLYIQLKNAVQSAIANGSFNQGDKIPTEIELAETYNVSRITVRKAIEELVREGYLTKRQGKGTFVNRPKIGRKIEHIISFTAACKANGVSSHSVVTERKKLKADADTAERLQIQPGESVLYIQRQRYAGEQPLMLENNYYPFERFAFLMEANLEGSIYELLRSEYNIDPNQPGETILQIVLADEPQAKLLEVPIGQPLFYMNTIIYDQNSKPVHVGKQFIIGDRYQFTL